MNWTAVVAAAQNDIIGRDGDLPWRLRSDLRRFKNLTMGNCLLMGRKTMESIGRALPGRQTIVLSRSNYTPPDGVTVVASVDAVEEAVETGRDVMVVGGAQIYAATWEKCNRLWLTRVLASVPGDTRLPPIDFEQWVCQHIESVPAGEFDQYPTEFQQWTRR